MMGDRTQRYVFHAWLFLGGAALVAGAGASSIGLPAAWLIGPLLLTLVLAWRRPQPHPPRVWNHAAQAVVGAALTASFDWGALAALARWWPLVGGSVALILALSVANGLLLARVAQLDRATGVLGMIPGGASGMVAISDELGADTPLVAWMQYARLCVVAVSASLLAHYVLDLPAVDGAQQASMLHGQAGNAGVPWAAYGYTALIAVLGAWAGVRWRVPAGALVGPVLVGVLAGVAGIEHGRWPPGVLPAANAIIGIGVGGRFGRAALQQIRHSIVPIVASMLLLMAGCALIGSMWVVIIDLDPLSAYLATTPGGIDAVTIAALDTGAALAVIVPVQVLRLLVMVLVGPLVVRRFHRRVPTLHHQRNGCQ